MNWQKIKFRCSECDKESWLEIDVDSYVLYYDDLICDDCTPVEED